MKKMLLTAGVAMLAFAGTAHAALLPDAPPQAHGRHVTVLPACPEVPLPWNVKSAYVEEFQHGVIVCASEEGDRFAATMTFTRRPDCRHVQTMTTQWLCQRS